MLDLLCISRWASVHLCKTAKHQTVVTESFENNYSYMYISTFCSVSNSIKACSMNHDAHCILSISMAFMESCTVQFQFRKPDVFTMFPISKYIVYNP